MGGADADEDRRRLLDYRHRAFAQPSVVRAADRGEVASTSARVVDDDDLLPPASCQQDLTRCVLHFDLDCWYAQVEEHLDPSLRGKPLGVTQKYLVVTANYEARELGVHKLQSTKEALKLCPSLNLRSGEDLTPYRRASRNVEALLANYGTVERLGLDEFFVDVTSAASRKLAEARPGAPPCFAGVVHSGDHSVRADTHYRPQDLRSAHADADARPAEEWEASGDVPLLAAGSQVAAEARAALKATLGFNVSTLRRTRAPIPSSC